MQKRSQIIEYRCGCKEVAGLVISCEFHKTHGKSLKLVKRKLGKKYD